MTYAYPKCGIGLEPRMVRQEEERVDPELAEMTRRFWISLFLTIPILAVVFWGGWPFSQRELS